MVSKVNRSKYWEEQYMDATNIREWFKDYKSYYPEPNKVSSEQCKKDFLAQEKEEIKECIVGKDKQEKIYAFVESVINNIGKWRKKK